MAGRIRPHLGRTKEKAFTMWDQVSRFLDRNEISANALFREAGYANANILYNKAKQGEDASFSYTTLVRLSQAATRLLGRQIFVAEILGEISDEEAKIIGIMRRLDPRDRRAMVTTASALGAISEEEASSAGAGANR